MSEELDLRLKALQRHFEQGDESQPDNVKKEEHTDVETLPNDLPLQIEDLDTELTGKIKKDKKLLKKATKVAGKLAREKELLEMASTESEESEPNVEEKKERVEMLRDDERLNQEAFRQEEELTKQKEDEEKEREKRINYLAENLVDDMKIFYGAAGIDKREATDRLKVFGVQTVYRSATDQRKDYDYGKALTNKLEDFFRTERGFPSGWGFMLRNLKPLGLNLDELVEARSQKTGDLAEVQEKENKKKASKVYQEVKSIGLSFEEKEKIMQDAGYGGTLFADYKKYLEEGVVPADLDNVILQVGKLFQFDLREFAEEWRERGEKEKDKKTVVVEEAAGWKDRLLTDPLLSVLKEESTPDRWESKVQTWADMDTSARETELQLYRVLVKIRTMKSKSPELYALWEKHKNRLGNLGLVV